MNGFPRFGSWPRVVFGAAILVVLSACGSGDDADKIVWAERLNHHRVGAG